MGKINCANCGVENNTTSKYCLQCGYELPKPEVELFENQVQRRTPILSKEKKKKLLGILAGIIAFVFSCFALQQIFFSLSAFDKAAMSLANELNKTCPTMVDEATRLDNVTAMPDNIFQYNFTLIYLKKSQVNTDTLKKYIEPEIIKSVKTNPQLEGFRNHETTVCCNYRDKDGTFLLKILVTPDLYK